MRSRVVVSRTRTADPTETPEISFYLSSIVPREGCADTFARLLRGHWAGSENRNHWIRDHCLREDRTRLGSYAANCVLAGLRVCLLVIKSLLYPQAPWPSLAERCQYDPSIALAAVGKLQAK